MQAWHLISYVAACRLSEKMTSGLRTQLWPIQKQVNRPHAPLAHTLSNNPAAPSGVHHAAKTAAQRGYPKKIETQMKQAFGEACGVPIRRCPRRTARERPVPRQRPHRLPNLPLQHGPSPRVYPLQKREGEASILWPGRFTVCLTRGRFTPDLCLVVVERGLIRGVYDKTLRHVYTVPEQMNPASVQMVGDEFRSSLYYKTFG